MKIMFVDGQKSMGHIVWDARMIIPNQGLGMIVISGRRGGSRTALVSSTPGLEYVQMRI
jgi:hypothetical protein